MNAGPNGSARASNGDRRSGNQSGEVPWATHVDAVHELAALALHRGSYRRALLGFARWRWQIEAAGQEVQEVNLPTEYNHYEGAVAHTLGLPLLVLVQANVYRRVVFDSNYKGYVGIIPEKPALDWLDTNGFRLAFGFWRQQLEMRRDVFLGYCGSSTATALEIKAFLTTELKVSVLDWATDLDPATTILYQIEEAAKRCGAGIFLFTRDDRLEGEGAADLAAPRDNVVFEAGYFIALKGKSKVLIVREKGAKMPADLGGYLR